MTGEFQHSCTDIMKEKSDSIILNRVNICICNISSHTCVHTHTRYHCYTTTSTSNCYIHAHVLYTDTFHHTCTLNHTYMYGYYTTIIHLIVHYFNAKSLLHLFLISLRLIHFPGPFHTNTIFTILTPVSGQHCHLRWGLRSWLKHVGATVFFNQLEGG